MVAWDLIGFDGRMPYEPERSEMGFGCVRISGGRMLYEGVSYNDDTRGTQVKLWRLETATGIRVVARWVDPETPVEFVPDAQESSR